MSSSEQQRGDGKTYAEQNEVRTPSKTAMREIILLVFLGSVGCRDVSSGCELGVALKELSSI